MNTPHTSIKGQALVLCAAALVALLAVAFAAAIAWGGPAPIAPLASIDEPFANTEFSTAPVPSHYTARDGKHLRRLTAPSFDRPCPCLSPPAT